MPHENSVFHSLLKQLPWGIFDRIVSAYGADKDGRVLTAKSHLIAMLYAQLSGACGLREIELGLTSHEARLYHLGVDKVARSTLAEANRYRPAAIFTDLFAELTQLASAGLRRKMRRAVRLIDATSVSLSGLSRKWAEFSAHHCGVKAHVMYDPTSDRPVYLQITPANVNDITAAKEMPIEPETDYVIDLGYYDFGWWAKIHAAGSRFVTRLKSNSPFTVVEERTVPTSSASILSNRIGRLSTRLAASRKNPMTDMVREVRVRIETGKILRLVTNDLEAPAQEIADLYKRRWAIELFFRWVKQTLKIRHFFGTSENAVRIQIATALIAFLLLRMAQAANKLVDSPLAFVRLIRANLMHRRQISRLLDVIPPQQPEPRQLMLAIQLGPPARHTRPPLPRSQRLASC